MAETHCFIGTREVGKPKLRTTSSGASTASSVASTSRKSPQRISDILRLRRLRLNRAKTTASNSLSDRYDDDGVLYDYSNRQRIEKGNTYLLTYEVLFSKNSSNYKNSLPFWLQSNSKIQKCVRQKVNLTRFLKIYTSTITSLNL